MTKIKEQDIVNAAAKGMDEFVQLFADAINASIGGELTAENMVLLNGDQITLLAYMIFRDEVMNGGFIQLIHNGYGPFIFDNPFAKAMRLWGAKQLTNLVYDGKRLYEQYKERLTAECSDEEFMALFEQFPEFDDLDDAFVEMEEEVTEAVAVYIDNHIDRFADVEK
ncbi:MAG: DMP19 family protein [Bacteroidaceae bacterium]|nr:DMP19 family protein [Bacteroidaceae bacterium]